MNNNINAYSVNTIFFDLAVLSFFIMYALSQAETVFSTQTRNLQVFLSFCVMGLSFLSIITNFSLHSSKCLLFIIGSILLILLSRYFQTAYNYSIITQCLLICAAYRIPQRHIFKLLFRVSLFIIIAALALYYLNITQDNLLSRDMAFSDNRESHTFGFVHYSSFSFRCMTLTYLYMLTREKELSWIKLSFIFALNLLVYQYTFTRLHLLGIAFILIMYIAVYKKKKLDLSSTKWYYFAMLSYPLFALLFVLLGLGYASGSVIVEMWDEFFSGRMSLTLLAFATYGISLLGNKIEMKGVVTSAQDNDYSTVYIDSGYAYWLLAYGLLFFFILLFAHAYIFRRAYLKHNRMLIIVFSWFAFANLINDFFNFFPICPLLLLLFCDDEEQNYIKGLKLV